MRNYTERHLNLSQVSSDVKYPVCTKQRLATKQTDKFQAVMSRLGDTTRHTVAGLTAHALKQR